MTIAAKMPTRRSFVQSLGLLGLSFLIPGCRIKKQKPKASSNANAPKKAAAPAARPDAAAVAAPRVSPPEARPAEKVEVARPIAPAEAPAKATGKLAVVGTPRVTRTGRKGNDGTPEVNITVTLNKPVPKKAASGRFEICTNKCWPQKDAEFTPGSKKVTLGGWLHHSLYKDSGEYARITFYDANLSKVAVVKFSNLILPPGK